MRNQCLVGGVIAASLSLSSPAEARAPWEGTPTQTAAFEWEAGYLALSAIDAGETIHCLHEHKCTEGNPIFGKHPSAATLIAAKVGLGAVHFVVFDRANDRNPKAALRLAQMSCMLQGGVVGFNARLVFK